MTGIDYIIVAVFLIAMALAGLTITRLIRDSDDFFVASRELTPFILAATITATNLSMFNFIGMGGIAYQKGVSIIWQTWTGNMALVLSGIFILPVMRRLRIRSVPEFLEMRYSRSLRILIGAFWGVKLCIFLGIILYIAATASVIITGWDNYIAWLLIFSVISIVYSAIGGAWAVALMDTVQFVFMLAGALIVLPIATHLAGGIPAIIEWLRANGHGAQVELVPSTGEFSWLFIVAMVLLSSKWATVDQAILQRAYGAKDPRSGAKGMVLSALITTPFAFFWIVPGLAIAKLNPGMANPDHAVPWLLSTHLPLIGRGLLGVVLCGLVAAQVSTITADINSVATLFTSDVFRYMFRKPPTQRQLLSVVRISSLICGVLMLIVAYVLKFSDAGAVRANLAVVGILDMPLFVVAILYGLFWKRTTWQGAMTGFFSGGAVGIFAYLLIGPKYFDGYLHPAISIFSSTLATWVTGCHEQLKGLAPSLLSIAPIVSAATAIVITPLVSLLTKHSPTEHIATVWESFKASTEDGQDETDTFHFIPRSPVGKVSLVLIIVGGLVFLAGVLSAIWAVPCAACVAITGMLTLFVGGLVRVYVE